jgi:dynactin-4
MQSKQRSQSKAGGNAAHLPYFAILIFHGLPQRAPSRRPTPLLANMARPFPYTYYSCSCVDTAAANLPLSRKSTQQAEVVEEDDEQTFDPRSSRANFSLYPLEHLLYCTECHQLRCARCTIEEVVCWYCPSCLFEVASSTVRSEGNRYLMVHIHHRVKSERQLTEHFRCSRSCYNCPICTSFLSVNLLDTSSEDAPAGEVPTGPFILSCSYCHWTSLDIGIKFEKANNITGQLQRIRNGGRIVPTPKERESQAERLLRRVSRDDIKAESPVEEQPVEDIAPDAGILFSNLNAFYKAQLADTADMATFNGASSDFNISSPSSISRLLNMYTTGKKTKRGKPKPMREALSSQEGLQYFDEGAEYEDIQRLQTEGWESTTSYSQRQFQERHSPHFAQDLRPVASLLRTKRSKRCKTCRTLLSRPEPKVSTTRYKIKVLALNNVPKISLRSLNSNSTSNTASFLTASSSSQSDYAALQPLTPCQFLLTLTNPLFDPIRVTLATPATTPGRVQTRVTILCPQFDVGANTDVWDEALNSTANKRRSAMPGSSASDSIETKQAEAGKVWEKGRNWTSVILEVVPGVLPGTTGHAAGLGSLQKEEVLEDDEDLLEVPVFVRLEYETEAAAGEEKRTGEGKEKREVAFWCVLGVGKIVD